MTIDPMCCTLLFMPAQKDYVLVADGDALSEKRLARLCRGRLVIAVDGAAELLRKRKILPHLVMGDFDSISPATQRYLLKNEVKFFPTPSQDTTDLEKALHFAMIRKPNHIHIVNALGNRTDHSLANMSFLKKFAHAGTTISLHTEEERSSFCKDQSILFKAKKNSRIGILGFPRCTISSQGLGFELDSAALELGHSESISNFAARPLVALQIRGDALLIVEEQ